MPISKKEIDLIAQTEGFTKGAVLKTDAQYILAKKGEEGLRKVEAKTKEWGHHIDYSNIKNMRWLPVGFRTISILAAKEVFKWDDKDIYDMGYSAPSYSFVVKVLTQHFLTFEQVYKAAPRSWRMHYTIGNMETPEFNKKKGYSILEMKDFSIHPALCPYYAGYFLRVARLASPFKISTVKIKESKCVHKGDDFHEFVVSWDPKSKK